ncbi:sulfotransferase family protein [Pseudoruegeria sp. HB172150]|uniref:sulfotransferase family protein n=1 Tax=Pseudoruegeria sp. HB172150 TaxID=2721164 RepID=UPI001C12FA33|nr:sulfotransferase family protein [Pseudoruegeria sp. HB172150]
MKIFGIGFHKTGTTSLGVALNKLGYKVIGPTATLDPDIADKYLELTRTESHHYDAFEDNPWPLVFREMDEMWPDAKFILTVRDPQKWIGSCVKHFGEKSTPMRELIYGKGNGAPLGNEEHYVRTMVAHNEAVRSHFADRPGKLLEMDFSAGDGWEKLCPFLGHPMFAEPFPRTNTVSDRARADRPMTRLMRRGRRMLRPTR